METTEGSWHNKAKAPYRDASATVVTWNLHFMFTIKNDKTHAITLQFTKSITNRNISNLMNLVIEKYFAKLLPFKV